MINEHKSNKIKENSNTVRHLNNGTDHRHSKSCCDQSSPARRTINIKNWLAYISCIWHLLTTMPGEMTAIGLAHCGLGMPFGNTDLGQHWWKQLLVTRARFLSLTWSKLRLCSANHRAGYFSNLACDWLSIVWAYSKQETENGPWCHQAITGTNAVLSSIKTL